MSRLYLFHQQRVQKIISVLLIFGGFVLIKFFYIQILSASEYSNEVEKTIKYKEKIEGERGNIYDRNGVPLAVNITKADIWINTNLDIDHEKIKDFFTDYFDMDNEEIDKIIMSKKTNYLRIKKNIVIDNIDELARAAKKIYGLNIDKKRERFYPYGKIVSHIIGHVDESGEGKSGLEIKYNEHLKGKQKIESVLKKSNLSKRKNDNLSGNDIYLTIDIDLQRILFNSLELGKNQSGANSTNGIIVDPHTGSVLAMAGAPSFDPNNYSQYPIENFKNNVVSFQYEPGSTIKVIPYIKIKESENTDTLQIDCENGEYYFPNTSRSLRDHEPHDTLSIEEVVIYSSNIGIAKISDIIGKEITYDSFREFGLGVKTDISLPGEERGVLRKLKEWSRVSHSMVSIGQEISVTNLQLAMIYASIANGGYLLSPKIIKSMQIDDKIIKKDDTVVIRKVMEYKTSRNVLNTLENVVKSGTGDNAIIPGYKIAGKTGTAEKSINGEYSDTEFISSFASIFPSHSPRLICVISVDSPEYYKHYGNISAAPIIQNIYTNIINQNLIIENKNTHKSI